MSTGPPQTGNCPLVLCHNASLAQVPVVALMEDDPRVPHAWSPSSVPTFTLVTPPHTPWGHKCCARLPSFSRDSDSSHQLRTNLHTSAILGSSLLAHVLSSFKLLFFFFFFLDPHCSPLLPGLDGMLSILSLTDFLGFEFQEAGTGVSVFPMQKALCAPLGN